MQHGRREGERDLLRLMIESRFGPISRALDRRLVLATEPELGRWAVRILSAETVDAIFV